MVQGGCTSNYPACLEALKTHWLTIVHSLRRFHNPQITRRSFFFRPVLHLKHQGLFCGIVIFNNNRSCRW